MEELMTVEEIEWALRDMPEVEPPTDAELDAMERELGLPSWRASGAPYVATMLRAAGL